MKKSHKITKLAKMLMAVAVISFLYLFVAEGYLTNNEDLLRFSPERDHMVYSRNKTYYLGATWAYSVHGARMLLPCSALGALLLEAYQWKFGNRKEEQ